MLKHHLKQRGDTIVEVMIVLAVLGLAVGISYATANRSLLQARQAQENTKATELLRSQVEQLRYLAPNNDSADPTKYIFQSGLYCIDSITTKIITSSDPACKIDSLYEISIAYDSTMNDTFTLKAVWENVQGQGNDTVTLIYRLHPS